jgi:phasin
LLLTGTESVDVRLARSMEPRRYARSHHEVLLLTPIAAQRFAPHILLIRDKRDVSITRMGGASSESSTRKRARGNNAMRETSTAPGGTRAAGAASQAMRDAADKGSAQARESFENVSAAAAEASSVIQNAYSTATEGAREYNAKLIECARDNSNTAFDYASKLLAVKSPSEFFEISAAHARKQAELMAEQARELTDLSQKVMRESAKPLNAGIGKAFQGPLS